MKRFVFAFSLLSSALPMAVCASESVELDYSRLSFNYGLGIFIILMFVIGSFVLSKHLNKRLSLRGTKTKDLEALKKEKERSLEEKWKEYMKNKENSGEIQEK